MDADAKARAAPEISVAMIAYQHEAFIRQAVESVLMQEVDRPWELVIGEDCSHDRTRAILREFASAHPATIRLLPGEQRLGAQRNFVRTLKACRGKYIALLEGDDYWISRRKLQRQADYLDMHPGCAICFHNALVLSRDRTQLFNGPDQKAVSTLEDLLNHNFLATCSVMYRAGLFQDFPDWFDTFSYGDWPLHILNAQHGTVCYINDVMAAYRRHDGGIYSTVPEIARLEQRLACYPTLLAHVGHRAHRWRPVRLAISDLHYRLAFRYGTQGHIATAFRHAVRSVLAAPLHRRAWLKPFGRLLRRRVRDWYVGTPAT